MQQSDNTKALLHICHYDKTATLNPARTVSLDMEEDHVVAGPPRPSPASLTVHGGYGLSDGHGETIGAGCQHEDSPAQPKSLCGPCSKVDFDDILS